MPKERSHILTIAGFDPSGGAGILADIKTFEQHRLLGMAVNTANTVQNDEEFLAVNWRSETEIFDQLDVLLKRFSFPVVKVGLLPSFGLLVDLKKRLGHKTKIVWDPVLSASAGFDLQQNLADVQAALKEVYCITPNWEEIQRLMGMADPMEAASELSKHCIVYLKGGHRADKVGWDTVFSAGKYFSLRPRQAQVWPKHGSGCILSGSLAAHFLKGYPLQKASLRAKTYTEEVLSSNQSLLGYHKR